ncbi:MAG: 23S rRNA (pseudouridine(1915)-N(3))-methyltransferase RlmH [Bacteroidota bacterium]
MKIVFIVIDKVSSVSLQHLIQDYENRLKHYCSFSLNTIIVPKNVRNKSIEEQKREEEKLIIQQLKDADNVVLLDEKGKEMSSVEFSKWLEKQSISSKRLVFVAGGPYGFSEDFKKKYLSLSLSQMTFSHEMVRLIFLEQLYRAMTILKGQKYHHE